HDISHGRLLLNQGHVLKPRPQFEANRGIPSLTVISITMPSQKTESFAHYGTEGNPNPAVTRHQGLEDAHFQARTDIEWGQVAVVSLRPVLIFEVGDAKEDAVRPPEVHASASGHDQIVILAQAIGVVETAEANQRLGVGLPVIGENPVIAAADGIGFGVHVVILTGELDPAPFSFKAKVTCGFSVDKGTGAEHL